MIQSNMNKKKDFKPPVFPVKAMVVAATVGASSVGGFAFLLGSPPIFVATAATLGACAGVMGTLAGDALGDCLTGELSLEGKNRPEEEKEILRDSLISQNATSKIICDILDR